ncbi:putative asparagine synthase [Mycena amicta]|nr:putative asparagine synthase [Mycena amicta]
MCGLTAAFYTEIVNAPSPETLQTSLQASLDSIKYRGPDSSGVYISQDARVGLGHVRLSIIDLETGQQPLSDEEETIQAVVTGEIYDHERIRTELQGQGYTFKTKSDSELVVQLYKRDGTNLFTHLRGEFAFVLYDAKRRLLFAARDRFGVKPLYYTVCNGCIMFASEMKAFLGLGWQPEWNMDVVVQLNPISDERTVFRGVERLPAGYFALCRASGHIKTQAYWDIDYPNAASLPTESLESMITNVREMLVESVRLRLRSDVPLAVYLSGGIDSSAVAGIATTLLREKNPDAKLTTFTLAYVEDPATDESPLAERTAVHIGADLVRVHATEQSLVNAFEDAMWHSEKPCTTFHAAGKTLLSKAVRDAGFKVVLSGEGSDELFGGYAFFPGDYLQASDPAGAAMGLVLPSAEERRLLAEDYSKLTHSPLRPPDYLSPEKTNTQRPLITTASHLALMPLFNADTAASDLFKPEVLERTDPPNIARSWEEGIDVRVRDKSMSGHWHPLNVSLYVISKTLLGREIIAAVGDRADMMHSVESRVAFLDHHLVDYVTTLPPSVKLMPTAGEPPRKWQLIEKWILRQAVKPFITEEIYLRKKVPFNPPPRPINAKQTFDSDSLLLPLQKHLKARITKQSVDKLGFLNWSFIREQLDGYVTAPKFIPHGGLDPRARLLMNVLGFIVLQEKFGVPTYQI